MKQKVLFTFLALIVTLWITSCTSNQNTDEVTTEIKKEFPVPQSTGTGWETPKTRENLPTPIPVSKQTKDGVQTRFVEPPVNDMETPSK